MKYYVKRTGATDHFEATFEQIQTGLKTGEIEPDWGVRKETDGVYDWICIRELRASETESSKKEFSNAEILEIAKYQKWILWTVLASLVAIFIPYALLFTSIVSVILVYQLAKALRSPNDIGYAIAAILPIIGIIALLVINGRATRTLRNHEISVGLMGARKKDLKNVKKT